MKEGENLISKFAFKFNLLPVRRGAARATAAVAGEVLYNADGGDERRHHGGAVCTS
jgi:hypothetical protein